MFPNRQAIEVALKALKESGFPMNKISLLTTGSTGEEKLSSENLSKFVLTRSEGVVSGATAGAATGSLLALAGGIAALLIPGIELALVAESVLTVVLGSAAVAGIGGLIGALEGWYIPDKQAAYYNDRLSQGDYLVTLEGTESEIRQAAEILNHWGIQQWRVFAPPTV